MVGRAGSIISPIYSILLGLIGLDTIIIGKAGLYYFDIFRINLQITFTWETSIESKIFVGCIYKKVKLPFFPFLAKCFNGTVVNRTCYFKIEGNLKLPRQLIKLFKCFSNAPIFSHISDTLSGLVTIRLDNIINIAPHFRDNLQHYRYITR